MPRAELRVFLAVLERLEVPTTVLCDCQGVVNGMNSLLQGHSRKWKEHGYLWGAIEELLRRLPDMDLLRVEKVAAHLAWQDVLAGRIRAVDWIWNDRVDAMAKRAGKLCT